MRNEKAAVAAPDDTELALSVFSRTPGAVDRLLARYEGPLLRYARSILGSPEDAEEVVQDAFVRACDALTSKYGEDRCRTLAVRPWLFQIVRNLSFNRRRGRRAPVVSLEIRPSLHEAPSAETHLHERDQRSALARAVRALPREARELIVLRFVEGLSYSDISRVMKRSEAALRSRTFRAIHDLRKALDGRPTERKRKKKR